MPHPQVSILWWLDPCAHPQLVPLQMHPCQWCKLRVKSGNNSIWEVVTCSPTSLCYCNIYIAQPGCFAQPGSPRSITLTYTKRRYVITDPYYYKHNNSIDSGRHITANTMFTVNIFWTATKQGQCQSRFDVLMAVNWRSQRHGLDNILYLCRMISFHNIRFY